MQATLLRTGATASSVYASARHHAESLYRPSTPFEERVEQERQPEAPMAALWGRAAAGATAGSTETTSVAPALRPQNIFPHQLLQVLSDPGNASAIAWLRHGHAFAITDPMAFAVHIMPRFTRGKLASFQRQLNIYGFRKVTKGADSSAGALVYFHPAFKRGRPEMLDGVKRIACKGALSLNRLRHDDVPYDVNVPSELTEQPELDVNSLDLHPPQAQLCKRQRIVFAGSDGVEESEAARKRRRCLEEAPHQRHGGGLVPVAMEPPGSAAQYSPEVRALHGRPHAGVGQKGRAGSRVAPQKQQEAQRRQYMMHLAAEKWAAKTKALESRDGSGQGFHGHGNVAQSHTVERHRRTAAVSASSSSAAVAAASAVSRGGVADATPLVRRSWLPSGMRTPSGATGVSSYTRANKVGDAGLVLPDLAGAGSRASAPWAVSAQPWRGQDADENEDPVQEVNRVDGGCLPRLDPQGEVTEDGLFAAGTTFELRSSGAVDAATSGSAASTWQEATSGLALQAEAQAGHQVSAAAKVSTTAHMPEADEVPSVTGPWVPLISYLEDDVDYSKLFEF